MNIGKIKPILISASKADDVICLVGKHGIGKSEIVRDYCSENDLFFTPLFLSQSEVGDLIGIPISKEDEMIWTKPEWLVKMETAYLNGKKCVLFLDELNRASTDVLNASLQLILEKQIHMHKLPKNTQVISAVNPADDDQGYMVSDFDPALWDRMLKLDVEADAESWLGWARKNNINKIVRDFIANNQSKLYFITEDSNEMDATPRSWTKLASYIDDFKEISEEYHLNIINGKIGRSLGAQFYIFYTNYKDIISIDDIEKFIKKEANKTKDLVILGEKLKDFTEKIEPVILIENVNILWDKYKKIINDETKNYNDILTLFVLLYSLDMEVLTSIIKDKKENDSVSFYDLVKKDTFIVNGKNKYLIRKIKSKII